MKIQRTFSCKVELTEEMEEEERAPSPPPENRDNEEEEGILFDPSSFDYDRFYRKLADTLYELAICTTVIVNKVLGRYDMMIPVEDRTKEELKEQNKEQLIRGWERLQISVNMGATKYVLHNSTVNNENMEGREEEESEWADETFVLGLLYFDGIGLQDDAKGAACWELGVKKGHRECLCALGVAYLTARGVAEDINKAVRLYKMSAAKGHPAALSNLGLMHLQGKNH